MALTDTALKGLKPTEKPTKHSDGGGLHVLVSPKGSKLWRLSYRFDGKQQTLALGSYPAVTLADARRERENVKALLAKGINPSQHAKLERIAKRSSNALTFKAVTEEFLEKIAKEGKAETTQNKKEWLLGLAMADIGARPISEITASEVLVPLRRIEAKGNYETARRVRSTIGQIFRYAIATARTDNDPTFGLKGALTAPVVTHRAAITDKKTFGGLLRSIWAYEGMPETRLALQLMALLYPRPGELRQATWSEIDFDKAVWTLPASRMKMRREHRKPLSAQALAILKELHTLTGDGKLMFPAVTSRTRTMSENTMNSALRRMGFSQQEATAHGFRASASSLLNESGKWSPDAIEAELAHVGADEVRKAYHRALYWDERVKMAGWWATYLDETRQT
ncbi:integrase arm-type DNA-binding domain-containing protein [Rhizobium sp. AG855]|uniref:tyrosine-type recombinase/integrase n=1 Tax=Rhizobium sp. AG855 TaxID=2183898 RepID=UPI000E71C748|nr:integrase arm-type DNA-binding domain-containing protein [Rhizobium sp. AG855]RKE78298.1 integrase [Rhizobium sp. AG855]